MSLPFICYFITLCLYWSTDLAEEDFGYQNKKKKKICIAMSYRNTASRWLFFIAREPLSVKTSISMGSSFFNLITFPMLNKYKYQI